MKRVGLFLTLLMLTGWMGVSAAKASDKVLLKEKLATGNYCHMKFPAIDPSTLDTKYPVLKNPATGDIIDFYGRCDENPAGKDQAKAQRLQQQRLDSQT